MTTNNGGAPADGGNEAITHDAGGDDVSLDTNDDAGTAVDEDGGRRPLTSEEYETRDRQKTAALRAERLERKADRDRFTTLERELQALKGTKGGPTQAELDDLPDEADLETDPATAVRKILKFARNFREQQVQSSKTSELTEKQQQFITSTVGFMNEAETEFAKDYPDYNEAVKHYVKTLREDLEGEGFRGAGLENALRTERLKLVHNARINGADPAEIIWRKAIKRGYVSKKADGDLDRLEQGQRSATEIPRGGSPRKGVTHQSLLKAEGKDFEKQWAEYEKKMTRA